MMYMDELTNKQDYEISNIEPQFDKEKLMGGHFNVFFGATDPVKYQLSFGSFISYLFTKDEKLKTYVANHMKRDETGIASFSDVITDLYSIEFPVEEKVKDYVTFVKDKVSEQHFNSLILLFRMMQDMDLDGDNKLDT